MERRKRRVSEREKPDRKGAVLRETTLEASAAVDYVGR